MNDDAASPNEAATVRLELEDGYRFRVDLGEGLAPVVMDEPPPLGEGTGPNASRLLAAAVGNCLSASLVYCLRRAHVEVASLRTDVEVTTARNDAGRLRIGSLAVRLHPEIAPGAEGRVARCLKLFESFCVVTESVRAGVPVEVEVVGLPGDGQATTPAQG